MSKIKSIAVYCGSSPGANLSYTKAAAELGQLLVQHNIGLVYGGGNIGLMGRVASTVLQHGGHVTGVIPEFFLKWDIGTITLSDLRIVQSMHERKAMMESIADAFIALPGGLGTLEELAEILTWAQLGLHAKPVGLLNTDGFYNHLIRFLDHAVDQQLLKEKHRSRLIVANHPEELLQKLLAAHPHPAEPKLTLNQT